MRRSARAPSLIALARVLAWGAGYGAALIVAYDYQGLPEELPLSRWTAAPKTMFMAVRVPLAHLALIALCELLARCLLRAPAEHRPAAERTAAALLCAAGLKAWLSAKAIISLPDVSPALGAASFAVMAAGVVLGAWFARTLIGSGAARTLRFTRTERALGALLIAALLVLSAPLVAPALFS